MLQKCLSGTQAFKHFGGSEDLLALNFPLNQITLQVVTKWRNLKHGKRPAGSPILMLLKAS